MDPIQHTVNALYLDGETCIVGQGSYKILGLVDNKVEWKLEIGWEVRDILADENHIFVASLGEMIQVYSKASLLKVQDLPHPLGVINLYLDGSMIYSGSYDGYVRGYDTKTFQLKQSLPGHKVRCNSMTRFSGMLVTGDGFSTPGCSIKFWKDDHKINEISLDSKRINSLAEYDGLLICTTSSPNYIVKISNEMSFEKQATCVPVHSTMIFDNSLFFISANKIYDNSFRKILELGNPIISSASSKRFLYIGYSNCLAVFDTDFNLVLKHMFTRDGQSTIIE